MSGKELDPTSSIGLSRRQMLIGTAFASVAALSSDLLISAHSHAAIIWGFPLARYIDPRYGFGMRDGRMHEGIDYPDSSGPPVYSIADGVINNVANHANYGLFVEIEHDNGWSSFYAHLRGQSVIRGQRIGRGTQVGLMGNTGASVGTHLHLEMRTRPGGPAFDPAPYVNRNSPLPGQNPAPPPPAPISQEDSMAYPIRLNGTHLYLIAPGFIKHINTNARVGDQNPSGLGVADMTMTITAPNDQWISIDTENFLNQLDNFGIPRSGVDVVTGYVHDVDQARKIPGGVWSWARESRQYAYLTYEAINGAR